MFIPTLILITLFSINNAKRARAKGLHQASWVFYTIIAFILGLFVASFILGLIILFQNPNFAALAQNKDREGMNKYMIAAFTNNEILYSALLFAGGLGGHLFVRYLLEKKPNIEENQHR